MVGREGDNDDMTRASLALSHLILATTLQSGYYYYSHLTDEETGTPVENHSPTVGKWNPGQGAFKEWETVPTTCLWEKGMEREGKGGVAGF